jgi:hypothetical protein
MTKKIIDALSAVSVAIFLGIALGRVRFLVEARVCRVCFCALLFLAQHPVHAAASLIGPLLISNQATRGRNGQYRRGRQPRRALLGDNRYIAVRATKVGAIFGLNDLEAIGDVLNARHPIAPGMRQADHARPVASRAPQFLVPLVSRRHARMIGARRPTCRSGTGQGHRKKGHS